MSQFSLRSLPSLIAVLGAFCVPAFGQQQDVFEGTIHVTQKDPLSVGLPSPMIEGQIGCTADGSLVVHSILEMDMKSSHPRSNPQVLNVIEPNGSVHRVEASSADDVDASAETRAYDVGRDVLLLVDAYPKLSPSTPHAFGTRSLRALRFDRQGKYHGSIDLEFPAFQIYGLAGFDNGDLLLFGVDASAKRPRLAHFSPIGNKLHFYDPESDFAISNSFLPSSTTKDSKPDLDRVQLLKMAAAVQYTQYVHYKDSILLLQMNAGSPLFQAFPNGSIRTIKLPQVEGFSADSLIPSDDEIYVRYRRTGTNAGRDNDALILELSSNGDLLRKLHPGDFTMWDVVCARGDHFRVVKLQGDYEFQFFDATDSTR